MNFGNNLVSWAMTHSRKFITIIVGTTLLMGALAVIPSLNKDIAKYLHPVKVDTDPVSMLSENEPVRVTHFNMKKQFGLSDIIVLGIENKTHPDGVFNIQTLSNIYELAEFSKTLSWENPETNKNEGVIAVDIIAPSTVDNIEQGGPGEVKFSWLMPRAPATREEALQIREKALNLPFLKGTLISENGKSLAIYLPITNKDMSYKISQALQKKADSLKGDDHFYITGLPVANDTFGVQMFLQMAIAAPFAMLLIFLLLLYFFRKIVLIVSPMILAMITVVITMSLLVITGNTIHIMSSMIPIFIMPIAVLNSIHILSEFFDRYQKIGNRGKTVQEVIRTLFNPMLFTSLTSMAGFASLALTPIPPVQVFGIFVAIGIFIAWLLTITFIPAYIMLIPEKTLANFGQSHSHEKSDVTSNSILTLIGKGTYKYASAIVIIFSVFILVSVVGMFKIEINDNPVKWFSKKHPIRVADKALNSHFAGTYMTYLSFSSGEESKWEEKRSDFIFRLKDYFEIANINNEEPASKLALKANVIDPSQPYSKALSSLVEYASEMMDEAPDDEYDLWDEVLVFVEEEQEKLATFKQPEVLNYISDLQAHLLKEGLLGKSNSIADLVKTVHRELLSGKAEEYRIPDSSKAVAQCLISYQGSHRPQDLWHFVTSDYKKTNLWLQLKSGDNQSMTKLINEVDSYIASNPAPKGIEHKWFGLPYINVIWQEKMVSGMLMAFIGSFLVVFIMMAFLFKSVLWGLISMIPLSVTILVIYGLVGWTGKSYDMPVAVLSSMTLGLAVDFAIHFLVRARTFHGRWSQKVQHMFDEPANAISKNIIVIAIGFLPLLLAPLVPYQTVGIFLASILSLSGLTTLVLLPALVKLLERKLFNEENRYQLGCIDILIMSLSVLTLILINVISYVTLSWNIIAGGILLSGGISYLLCIKNKVGTRDL